MESTTVYGAIFAIFTEVLGWLIESLGTVSTLFWANGALTFLGTLSVIGLAIAVCLLLISIVRAILRFR